MTAVTAESPHLSHDSLIANSSDHLKWDIIIPLEFPLIKNLHCPWDLLPLYHLYHIYMPEQAKDIFNRNTDDSHWCPLFPWGYESFRCHRVYSGPESL